ncbi:MAG TPA: hypothetical protein VFJ71_13565 [Candidatus Limnocylindrales bacterium]|nr:hypothetical protein [Candidatus Limnocylindrales bacterium]
MLALGGVVHDARRLVAEPGRVRRDDVVIDPDGASVRVDVARRDRPLGAVGSLVVRHGGTLTARAVGSSGGAAGRRFSRVATGTPGR